MGVCKYPSVRVYHSNLQVLACNMRLRNLTGDNSQRAAVPSMLCIKSSIPSRNNSSTSTKSSALTASLILWGLKSAVRGRASQVCLRRYWSWSASLACWSADSIHDNAASHSLSALNLGSSYRPERLSSNSQMINQFQLPPMWSILFS